MDAYRLFSNCFPNSETRFYSNSSGLASLHVAPSPDIFWKQIQRDLTKLPPEFDRAITKVVLTGDESITNPQFQATLRDALHEIVNSSHLPTNDQSEIDIAALVQGVTNSERLPDPIYAAARGAALYARWRHESLFYCYEEDICDAQRHRERNGLSEESLHRMELK